MSSLPSSLPYIALYTLLLSTPPPAAVLMSLLKVTEGGSAAEGGTVFVLAGNDTTESCEPAQKTCATVVLPAVATLLSLSALFAAASGTHRAPRRS